MILKTSSRLLTLFGMTQGGAKFNKWNSFQTSLSGVKLDYQFPGYVHRMKFRQPEPCIDLEKIDWSQCDQLTTRFFEEQLIAQGGWYYYGSFLTTAFQPIGDLRFAWYVTRVNNRFSAIDLDINSLIEYLKKLTFFSLEDEGNHNYEVKKDVFEEYRNKDLTDPFYQELIKTHLDNYCIKVPDDFTSVSINGKDWVRFTTNEKSDAIMHVLPLNNRYLLVGCGKRYHDFYQERYRWVGEAEKIIESIMQTVNVTFPEDWQFMLDDSSAIGSQIENGEHLQQSNLLENTSAIEK